MKILLGVPEYPPYHIGGGGEVFKNLAENYKKLGHDVVVVYGYYPTKSWFEEIKEYTSENGIKFYQIPEIPYFKSMPFLKTVMPCNFKTLKLLKNIIKREKPDVAHLHGYGLFMPAQISKICNRLKIRYILTLHGAPVSPKKMKNFLISIVYSFYNFFYGSNLLKNAQSITAVSHYTTTFREFNKYKNKISIINNGIDTKSYLDASKFIKLEKRNDGEIVFLSLGRIEWLKGFQYFIDIIPILLKNNIKLKYLIGGTDQGFKFELEKKIKDYDIPKKVIFLEQLDFKQKIEAILNSDYVIISSLVENYPAVPIETIILGKIPIGNNIGGIPEIIKDQQNGFLVDVLDKDKFSEKVLSIIRVDSKQIKFNNGDKYRYEWENIVQQYLKVLNI